MLIHLLIICLLIYLWYFNWITPRDNIIPVPTIYKKQNSPYIYHKFPVSAQIFSTHSKYLYKDKNIIFAQGFRSKNFDGKIPIKIMFQNNEYNNENTILEIAPWVLKDNSNKITQLFVSSKINKKFLESFLNQYNINIIQCNHKEQWLRDEFQVGYMGNYTYIMNGPKNSSLDSWIERLSNKNKNLYHFHLEKLCSSSSYNFFGNLICIDSDKILYGTDEKGFGLCSTIIDFIKAQNKQKLIPVYTSWLSVGHIDEIVCLMPDNKIAMNSPGLAIEQLKAMEFDTPILLGNKYSTVGKVLKKYAKYNLMIENKYLQDAKNKINADIFLPILFRPDKNGRAIALTYNLVNIIVDPRFLITPKDNGPIINGIPRWGKKMWNYFFPKIDVCQIDISILHNAFGGLHCATNEIRM